LCRHFDRPAWVKTAAPRDQAEPQQGKIVGEGALVAR
jgi:hypothetical protein